MKKILILLLGIAVALPSVCQTDIVQVYSSPSTPMADTLMLPWELTKRGAAEIGLFNLRLRKAVKQNVVMGMSKVYIPETDVQGGNAAGSQVTVISYQNPVSIQVSQAQLDQISAYIKNLLEPPVVQPKPDIVVDIDDADLTKNVYTPTAWAHPANTTWLASFFNKTGSYYHVAGSTIETSFDGYKIEWYTELKENHGIAGVTILKPDGTIEVPEVMVNLYQPPSPNNSQKVWTSPELPNGPHKIRIRITGNKTPAALDHNIIHDYFKVYKKQL